MLIHSLRHVLRYPFLRIFDNHDLSVLPRSPLLTIRVIGSKLNKNKFGYLCGQQRNLSTCQIIPAKSERRRGGCEIKFSHV